MNIHELIRDCMAKGRKVSYRKHPATLRNWENDWTPHDSKSVPPTSPNYRKVRAR